MPSNKKSNFDYKFDSEFFKVPLDDVSVYNGCIYVSTKNIEFIQDASWEVFCDCLAHNNQLQLQHHESVLTKQAAESGN